MAPDGVSRQHGDVEKPRIGIERVYTDPGRRGDYRVLVDRLWPRGVKKESLDIDEWAKDVAPSSGLRKWYGHDPELFAEFARRYRLELADDPGAPAVARLGAVAVESRLTLLTATRDVEHSGALVLRDAIAALTAPSRRRGRDR